MKSEFKKTYIESQQFRQIWVWLLLLVTGVSSVGVFAYGFYEQIILGNTFGDKPMSDDALIISFIVSTILFGAILFLFVFTRLTFIIDDSGITYKYFPFHLSYKKIKWTEIENYQIITYRPIKEYGGWGVRGSKSNRVYNVRGKVGLFVSLKDDKTILFGTQKEDELKDFLGT